ncbi:MAG TPA: hypothetical protein VF085_03645 [Solirubrobacterales bacterium]
MGISRRLLVVLPLAALAIAGCGGGGGSDSTAAAAPEITEVTTALSKEELIAQGDAICAEVNAAVGTAGSTSSDAAGQATQVAGLYDGMVERLIGLGAPSDETTGYPEFVSSAEALVQAQDDVKLASEREEDEALSAAETEASSALSSFQSAASTFGFEQCAEAPEAPTPSGSGEESGGEESSEGVEEESEEVLPEEVEPAPETGGVIEEESAGGGAGVGGGTGSSEGTGGSSGGIGPG